MIKLSVNGRDVRVDEGSTLLEAAGGAGVHIPTLCHYPRLPARAVCRICLVHVEGVARPQPACATMAQDGDVVETDAEDLREFRRADAQWLLARHPDECMRCEVNGVCKLQRFVQEYELEDRLEKVSRGPQDDEHHHRLTDHTSPSIWRDISKCIECGLCADACGEAWQQQYVIGFAERGWDRLPVTVFDRPLAETQCISCGQCTLVCPTGALIETPHWHEVLHTLDARRRISVVQVAPATRVAISEEFGLEPGTASTGKLINALRRLGFDYVFDTNFGADLTIMEEAAELVSRLRSNREVPLFTSCCPGWVNWLELNRPDLLPHLSTTKSPQQMHGALSKRGPFARSLGADFVRGAAEPYVVSVMPCTAKKDESVRPGMSGDVDHVLTTRELAKMIRARDIAFHALREDGAFDDPLGESTGAAQIFGASGGVMEAIARTASHFLGKESPAPLDWHGLRGIAAGVKTSELPGVGKVAVCNGIAAAQRLLETETWRQEFVAIEVMACIGGCLGGGGEPKSSDPLVLEKRMRAIYDLDKQRLRRRSHENRDVARLYATELMEPNSPQASALLHTTYAARNSARSLLMRFLDCVDRRDGNEAAALVHPEAVWKTASPFGDLRGIAAIREVIERGLPARKYGPGFARHRIDSAPDDGDLIVLAPTGERCRFRLELERSGGDNSAAVIKTIVREVL